MQPWKIRIDIQRGPIARRGDVAFTQMAIGIAERQMIIGAQMGRRPLRREGGGQERKQSLRLGFVGACSRVRRAIAAVTG